MKNIDINTIVKNIIIITIPIITFVWLTILNSENLTVLLIVLGVLSCLPLILKFIKSTYNKNKLLLILIMLAICIASRFILVGTTQFNPVTAIIIITGIYCGSEAGLLVGGLTPLITNIHYLQGVWTPFQMIIWGAIGFFAGVLYKKIKDNKVMLCAYGVFSGIVFSLFMDLWYVYWCNNAFNFEIYMTNISTLLPFMAKYILSNIVFLLLIDVIFSDKLEKLRLNTA